LDPCGWRLVEFSTYECGLTTWASIEPVAVGDALPEMPLFLEPEAFVLVPLEMTDQTAFDLLPAKGRKALESARAHP